MPRSERLSLASIPTDPSRQSARPAKNKTDSLSTASLKTRCLVAPRRSKFPQLRADIKSQYLRHPPDRENRQLSASARSFRHLVRVLRSCVLQLLRQANT